MSSASNSRTPKYSVVVVTYNSRDNIQVCLDSLRRHSGSGGDHEIIVVDNASRDGTPDYLSFREGIIALLEDENHGFSRACNLGAARATGEFLIFLNPDTLVTEGWSEAMARHCEDPAVGAVGPLSNYVAGLQRLDLHLPSPYKEGAKFPGEGAVEQSASVARVLKEANSGRGVTTKLLIGFCLMIRRELYAEMGGMDERLFLGNDDLDLSWRLRNRGLKLVVATDAFVFHEGQKSFRTEKKSHVDRLVQESTDALYLKLTAHYGGRDKVPSSMDLWGMNWFSPSPALLQGETRAAEARMANPAFETEGTHPRNNVVKAPESKGPAWKGLTALVWLGPGRVLGDEAARLERTLASLPPGCDTVVLNCSDWKGALPGSAIPTVRRLDLGEACTPRMAFEVAAAMAQERIFFCAAGVSSTALFNHWLDKRAASLPLAPVAFPVREDGSGEPAAAAFPGCALLCGKAWLRDAGAAAPASDPASLPLHLARFAGLVQGSPGIDSPWLTARAAELSAQTPAADASWTPTPPAGERRKWDEAIKNYPESLGPAMRSAKDIAFAGSIADMLPESGAFHVLDMEGARVPFLDQDLVILRLTPDMVDGLEARLRNLRRRGRSLRRLLVVMNSAQALRRPLPEGVLLAQPDVTPEGARAALWGSGFAVLSEKPYHGIPPVPGAVVNFDGWTLLEAAPRTTDAVLAKKVSIVILGFNQVEYTRKCIESIRAHTRQEYELILVDNGSKDGTEAFFRSIPGAKVIRNEENLGVSRGWNQGMRRAEGDYILIFNNDTIVGPGWLENMVRLCESDPGIGMVGPRSNYIAGPQVVKDVPYKTEAGIQDFIRDWQMEHDLSASEFDWIKGFCLLIPRGVFAKVGYFDERFGKGNFEDDDYCLRVRLHGFRTMIAHDAFIHHYGSVSFNQEDVDWKALMIENRRKYEEKWARGAAALAETQVAEPTPEAPASPAGTSRAPVPPASRRAAPDLSAADRAYTSGDIAAARRLYLEAQAARPDHPDPLCGLGVLAFHDGAHLDAGTLFLKCLEMDPTHRDAAGNLIDILKDLEGSLLLPDAESLAERFPENEVFAEALAAAKTSVGAAPVEEAPVLPPWRADIEARIGRREYAPALDALEAKVRSGQDLAVCFNYMGVIAHACGDSAFAAENFRRAISHGPADADPVYNLVDTLLHLGRAGEALRLLEVPPALSDPAASAAAEFPASADQIRHALERGGTVDATALIASREANLKAERLLRAGAHGAARGTLEQRLREDAGDFRALNNLGLTEWYQGRPDRALERLRACLAIRPAWSDALVNAFDSALAAGRAEEVRPLAAAALRERPDHPEALRIGVHLDREGPAISACRSFDALEEDAAILAKAERAMQEGRKSDAIHAFLEAVERRPKNPQALNGLGVVAFAEGRHADAYALFDAAVALHPGDQDILVNLWQAAHALRREGEVIPRLRSSLERNPAMRDVQAILESA